MAMFSSLPHDIVAIIASGFGRRDILSLCSTNRALYATCMPLLVKDLNLLHQRCGLSESLCLLLRRWPSLCMAVQHLSFRSTKEVSSNTWSLFADAMGSMIYLLSVTIIDPEHIFTLEPRVSLALARCKAINSIVLDSDKAVIGPRVVAWLKMLAVPAQNLQLCA